jgi:hypothetical protein
MTRVGFAAVACATLITAAGTAGPAHAESGQNMHVNAHFKLPDAPADGYFNLDVQLLPVIDPVRKGTVRPAYFYANNFGFRAFEADGVERRGCAYMGLQTDRNGKRAIFSIWGGTGASSTVPGAIVEPFTEISCPGYAGGWHIMAPLAWTTHNYRFRVWKLGTYPTGTEWGAWILDMDTGVETMIGTILVPNSWKGIRSDVVLFTEWYGGDFPSCTSLPRSNVFFDQLTANGGAETADLTDRVDLGGACPGSFIDWDTGVQEFLGH